MDREGEEGGEASGKLGDERTGGVKWLSEMCKHDSLKVSEFGVMTVCLCMHSVCQYNKHIFNVQM